MESIKLHLPDGYEIDRDKTTRDEVFLRRTDSFLLIATDYLDARGHRWGIPKDEFIHNIVTENYNRLPFELAIGLLRYACEKHGDDWKNAIAFLIHPEYIPKAFFKAVTA